MDSEKSNSQPERVHLAGSVRWCVTEGGRIVVQFADEADLHYAIALWDRSPRVLRHERNTVEFLLPEVE